MTRLIIFFSIIIQLTMPTNEVLFSTHLTLLFVCSCQMQCASVTNCQNYVKPKKRKKKTKNVWFLLVL